MPTKLVEAREKLQAKRDELAKIFAEHPDMDMPDEVAKSIAPMNQEISDLAIKFEELKKLEEIATENKAGLDYLNKPVGGVQHPGDQNPGGRGNGTATTHKSLGELFAESDACTGYQKALRQGPVSEVKADDIAGMLQTKTVLSETGFAPQAIRTGLIEPAALRRPVVADLIPQGTTTMNAIVYMLETTTTNAAAAVAEGNAKPESALAFTEQTAPVRKIATVLPITDELLADVPALRAYVDARLQLFLKLAEENELISGSGVSPHLTGILNFSGIQTQALGADPIPDAVYKAMVLIQTQAFLDPSGVIFNPLDWQNVRLLRTTQGIYIWGNPSDAGPDRIWGVPVISTTAQAQHTAIVAAFDSALQIFRRAEVTFAVSDQHSDFFIRNQLMLRIEERLALACYRPAGVCQVTGL